MNKQEELANELRGLSPWLNEQKGGREGKQIPADYFESFEDRLMSRIETEGLLRETPMQATRGGGFSSRLYRFAAAAAAVLVLAIGAWWVLRPDSATTASEMVVVPEKPDLSEEEVEAYLIQNIHEFDAEQLASIPEEVAETPASDPSTAPYHHKSLPDDLAPEDVEGLLKDMTDEELEEIL